MTAPKFPGRDAPGKALLEFIEKAEKYGNTLAGRLDKLETGWGSEIAIARDELRRRRDGGN